MVIAEAENIRLGIPTFEDERMDDDPDPESTEAHTTSSRSVYEQAAEYRRAKELLYDYDTLQEDKVAAVETLERLWEEGFAVAAHLLGKLYRDGVEVQQDRVAAKEWFTRSAQAGNDYSQYALGKMLLEDESAEAVSWLQNAADQGNKFAQYRLGKLYLTGEHVTKDIDLALQYLKDSAQRNNQFAQYTLGKLYLQGKEVHQDRETAKMWLELSAAQGNQYAQFFLDRFNDFRDPSILMAATRLLHHMSDLDTGALTLRIYTVRKRDFSKEAYEEYFNTHPLVLEHGFTWSADGRGVEKIFEGIATITEDEKEQRNLAQSIADIVKPYMELM